MDGIINQWLQKYEPINEIALTEEIHTEELTDNVKNLALQRTGIADMTLPYVSMTGWKKQYQYMLLLKSESESDKQRLTNLDWLDDFQDWFYERNRLRDYPILENKQIVEVSSANALTIETSDDGSISVYGLQIYFDVIGGM